MSKNSFYCVVFIDTDNDILDICPNKDEIKKFSVHQIINGDEKNSILGITKFNLLSLSWHREIIALGGICKNNLNRLKSASCIGCGFKSLINEV
jgi:hypothetical protein